MPLPDTYSLLYPGRFLKADMLKGKRVTLTIKNIDVEELVGESNKKEPKVVVSFVERPLEYVMPKTNGFCMKRMWGNNPHDWIGKRVTIFPTTTKFGREDVDCIRIYGSPDIPEDLPITIPQGRKKALEMVMHRVVANGASAAPPAQSSPDPVQTASMTRPEPTARMKEMFPLLGWGPNVCEKWLDANAGLTDAEREAKLEAELDK